MCTWLIMYTCASTFCVSLNEMHTHYTSDVIRFSPLMAIYRHKFALPWSLFFSLHHVDILCSFVYVLLFVLHSDTQQAKLFSHAYENFHGINNFQSI